VVIRSWIRISDHYSISITIAGILGDLLEFLIQSPDNFHDSRRNDWRRQGNESTTFWERPGRHPDPNPDKSGNPESNPGSRLVEVRRLGRGLRCLSTVESFDVLYAKFIIFCETRPYNGNHMIENVNYICHFLKASYIISCTIMSQGTDILENLSAKDNQRAYAIIQRTILDTDYPTFYK